MDNTRPAELRGTWYPRSETACDEFLNTVPAPNDVDVPLQRVVGAIVPHAGWTYSGAVAYRALQTLKALSAAPDLVLVFGGHLTSRDDVRILIEGGWETPYGDVLIDRILAEDFSMAFSADPETPDHYYEDNAIEVLMPMVKKLWPSVPAVTIGIPPTKEASSRGAECIDLARGRKREHIIVVGSTDLTHYGPNYRFSPKGPGRAGLEWVKTKNDPEIIEKMLALDSTGIVWQAERSRNACCGGSVAAALSACKKLGATRGTLMDYTTSFDVRPSEREPTSFVGYAGIVVGQ